MTEVDLAYLAGLLDGRGMLRMSTFGKNHPAPRIEVSDVRRETLEPLTKLHGVVREKVIAGRPTFYWTASYRKAQEVVRALRPYLKSRALEADAILRWQARKPGPRPRKVNAWNVDGMEMTKAGRGFGRRAV